MSALRRRRFVEVGLLDSQGHGGVRTYDVSLAHARDCLCVSEHSPGLLCVVARWQGLNGLQPFIVRQTRVGPCFEELCDCRWMEEQSRRGGAWCVSTSRTQPVSSPALLGPPPPPPPPLPPPRTAPLALVIVLEPDGEMEGPVALVPRIALVDIDLLIEQHSKHVELVRTKGRKHGCVAQRVPRLEVRHLPAAGLPALQRLKQQVDVARLNRVEEDLRGRCARVRLVVSHGAEGARRRWPCFFCGRKGKCRCKPLCLGVCVREGGREKATAVGKPVSATPPHRTHSPLRDASPRHHRGDWGRRPAPTPRLPPCVGLCGPSEYV